MPSAQVINLGSDPGADSIGNFARGFAETLNKRSTQKRNEDLFRRISQNYDENTDTDVIFRDILKSEGLDQEYKRDLLKEVKDYATIKSQGAKNGYEKAVLSLREGELDARRTANQIAGIRAANDANKINNTTDKNEKNLPTQIANYTAKALKVANQNFDSTAIADLNSHIEEQITDQKKSLSDAYNHALRFQIAKQQLEKEAVVSAPSSNWFSNKPEKEQSMQQAYTQLLDLYENSGITEQKKLKDILIRSGWKDPDATKILQRVFQEDSRKLKGPKPKALTTQQSANLPGQIQGQTSEQAGIDNLLFGE